MKIKKFIVFILTALLLVFHLYIDIKQPFVLKLEIRLLFVFVEILGLTILYLFQKNRVKDPHKLFQYLMIVLFMIYLENLIYLLLIDADFGRHFHGLDIEHIKINLVPFSTIKMFMESYHHHYLSLSSIATNLIGNIIAFAPFGLFLPILFKCERKFINFLITMVIIIVGVEVLQVITNTGIGDIDDFILNIVGALFVYMIIRFTIRKKSL